ncbi:MAG: MGMT family protein [Deltaproteobacteria bacterium]|nr:MGMT family protein [Deltaproteobacteria bacterium]
MSRPSERGVARIFRSIWGWAAVVEGPRGLREVWLPAPRRAALVARARRQGLGIKNGAASAGAAALQAYLAGRASRRRLGIDWSAHTPFERRVLRVVARIPAGETRTYGWVAARAGRPLAARAVGRAVGRNRCPILVPCHRVVGADGALVGYSGGGGLAMKQRLLQHEGVIPRRPSRRPRPRPSRPGSRP